MTRVAPLSLALALLAAPAVAKPPPPKQKPPAAQSKSFSISFQSSKGRLGASVVSMTDELRAFFGAPTDAGILVSQVEADTPAARAGVHVGDVITRVDGDAIADTSDVSRALSDRNKGDSVSLVVVRSKRSLTLTAKLDSDAPAEGELDFDFSLDGIDKLFQNAPGGQGWFKQWQWSWPGDSSKHPTPQMKRYQERLKKLEKKFKGKASGKNKT